MAAWRGGVGESSAVTSYADGIGDLVRRHAATLREYIVWVVIAAAVVAFWLGFVYGLAWVFG